MRWLAVAVYSHPRATMDIDILVRTDQLASALVVARQCGFDVPARKMVFGLRTSTPREMRLGKPSDRPWREREIAIVSRAGLATMKRIAGRPQDLAALAALEGTDDDEDA